MGIDLYITQYLSPIFYKLLYMSIAALCIGVVIMIVRRFADSKISPFWKCAMWFLVLVCLAVPYRPQSNLALLNNVEKVQDISFKDEELALRRERTRYKVDIQEGTPRKADESEYITSLEAKIEQARTKKLIFEVYIPAIWLFGFICFALFLIIGRFRLQVCLHRHRLATDERYLALLEQCKARLGIKSEVEIILQDYIRSPALLGIIRPIIILPLFVNDMSDESVEYIMLHELAHFKRFDMLLNLMLVTLQAVYWFNPLVWMMFRFIRQDMELANDTFVLERIGNENSKQYSLSLIEVLAQYNRVSFAPKLLCMVDGKDHMERRIKMIKLGEVFKKHRIVIAAISLVIICVVGAMFLTSSAKDHETMQWAKNLKIGDVKAIELVVMPSFENEQYKLFAPDEFERIVSLVNGGDGKLIKNKRNNDLSGGSIMLYITLNDGTIHTYGNLSNTYLYIDETFYSADYKWLSTSFDKFKGNAPLPVDFWKRIEAAIAALQDKANLNYAKSLYKNKTEYVGNNSKVGGIISNLRVQSRFEYKSFELFTKEAPYGIAINYTIPDEYGKYLSERITSLYFEKYALILLSLIDNVEYVNFNVTYGGKEQLSVHFNRDDIETILGLDVRSFAVNEAGFAMFIYDVINGRMALTKQPEIGTFKGLELYVWKNKELTGNDDTYFTLLSGTNRMKTPSEIYDLSVATNDIDDIRSVIALCEDGLHLQVYQMNETDFSKEQMSEIVNAVTVIAPANYSSSIGAFPTGFYSEPPMIDEPLYNNLYTAVSAAIIDANKSSKGEFRTEANTVLDTEIREAVNGSDTQTVIVYVMALFLSFDFYNGLSEVGGSHMPVAITFEKDAQGLYSLVEYWTPQDGSYYAPSIRKKFPANIVDDALDTQKYIKAENIACYEQAMAYGKIDADKMITDLISTICSSPTTASNPLSYIEAHQYEYRQLYYLGDYTLRYCFALFESGGQTGLEGYIMASACREIMEAKYGIVAGGFPYNTGQSWYDAVKGKEQLPQV